MWSSSGQAKLYSKANTLKNNGHYEQSMVATKQLLASIDEGSLPYAYVQGCIRAVNKRHLNRPEEAEADFNAAYKLANSLEDGQAIAAYILNDWSSMYRIKSTTKSIEMVKAAIKKLEAEGVATPDLERFVPADLAFFEATLERMNAQMGVPGAAKSITQARRRLKVRMLGLPRYEDVFLIVLGYECQMNLRRPHRFVSPAARYLIHALRKEEKREALLKLLLNPRYRARILGHKT